MGRLRRNLPVGSAFLVAMACAFLFALSVPLANPASAAPAAGPPAAWSQPAGPLVLATSYLPGAGSVTTLLTSFLSYLWLLFVGMLRALLYLL
jgi:hypothetical protein